MAYDGYRNHPGSYEERGSNDDLSDPNLPRPSAYTTPYPSQYTPERVDMPQPQMAPPPPPSNPMPQPYQDASRPQQPHQSGINDAIHSAFHKADTSTYLSPEVLSQITATVIQQLKATGLDNVQGQQQQQQPLTQSRSQQPAAHTPSNRSEASPSDGMRNVYTPPSPHRPSKNRGYQSPPPQTRYPAPPRASPRPTPPPTTERRESPLSYVSDHGQKDFRPKAPSRAPTLEELTTLERIWDKFFEDGKPTKRLGQFLRGIAVHLIENYPPGNTIVILPEKLQKFYEDTKVSDPYPWQDIFDDRTSSISRLYRAVEAEHHLVQEKLNERPDIPGLTPRGFERWATLMIQAHPDREYERLQKAVLAMPISNPDDKKERFPKEIPRSLFPDAPDLVIREKLEESIMTHCGVDLPPITEEERSKASFHRRTASADKTTTSSTSASTEPAQSLRERERPYSTQASAVIDDEEAAPARPIERERQPYIAQPGGGKLHEESAAPRHSHTKSFSTSARPKDHVFSPPSASGQRPSESYSQDPTYIRTGSSAAGLHPPVTRGERTRSSSVGVGGPGSYRHSESDLFTHNGGHGGHVGPSSAGPYQQTSSASTFPDDVLDDSHQYRDYDRDTEDGRTYESLRERERDRERERGRYHEHPPARGSWGSDEDYYRGMLGGQGGGPVSGGGSYKTYTYR